MALGVSQKVSITRRVMKGYISNCTQGYSAATSDGLIITRYQAFQLVQYIPKIMQPTVPLTILE